MNVAIVFPGQGSQSVGMIKDFYQSFPVISHTFEEASDALSFDLWRVIKEGPKEKLNQTTITQPAILAASIALWRLWRTESSMQVVALSGHSLGEYTALTASGVIKFKTALAFVQKRGQLMQEAVINTKTGMLAVIGGELSEIQKICDEVAHDQVLSPANYNAPSQIVIAGHLEAIERFCKHAQKKFKRMLKLPISIPSHCALMKPAADHLLQDLKKITWHVPTIPVIHNYDVKSHKDASDIINVLYRQLFSPVRWVEIVNSLQSFKAHYMIEIGPANVLSGLIKKINKNIQCHSIQDITAFEKVLGISS